VMRYRLGGFAAALMILLAAISTGRAEEPKLAISGYDSVAYFTEKKPVPGEQNLEYTWHNLRWRFSKAMHRDMFASDPDRYAPQYDGYCAIGIGGVDFAAPHKDTIDPEAWTIVDGKLYLAHSRESALWDEWKQDAAAHIKQSDEGWKSAKNQADPVIVGPPCRGTMPPTVIVTTKDGKRELLVAGQVAVDETGNIVGKGDLRAQLEQVGKNVAACLAAAGGDKSKILLNSTFVTSKEALSKNADVWARYLGPERAGSEVFEKAQFAGPDFLVKVQAVAVLN